MAACTIAAVDVAVLPLVSPWPPALPVPPPPAPPPPPPPPEHMPDWASTGAVSASQRLAATAPRPTRDDGKRLNMTRLQSSRPPVIARGDWEEPATSRLDRGADERKRREARNGLRQSRVLSALEDPETSKAGGTHGEMKRAGFDRGPRIAATLPPENGFARSRLQSHGISARRVSGAPEHQVNELITIPVSSFG